MNGAWALSPARSLSHREDNPSLFDSCFLGSANCMGGISLQIITTESPGSQQKYQRLHLNSWLLSGWFASASNLVGWFTCRGDCEITQSVNWKYKSYSGHMGELLLWIKGSFVQLSFVHFKIAVLGYFSAQRDLNAVTASVLDSEWNKEGESVSLPGPSSSKYVPMGIRGRKIFSATEQRGVKRKSCMWGL